MSLWTVGDVAQAISGDLLKTGEKPLEGVGIDTRKNLNNCVFFAIKGENFDGHDFLNQAVEAGASMLVVERDAPALSDHVSVVQVKDCLKALQEFGHWHRKHWKGKVVGLTGSNGKTTTKEFCHAILSQRFATLATSGNLNNHIGVPLTLLELREEHKFAVIEMGMNHAGEIEALTKMAEPDVVLVTNVGNAHIEFFDNGIEGVAAAKEEIYTSALDHVTRIYNLDNTHTALMRARAPGHCPVLTFSSFDRKVDVSMKEKVFTLDYIEVQGVIGATPGQAKIHAFGRQQVSNAMAASCVALACGFEPDLIWKGLAKCKTVWGRGQLYEVETGARILFDAYNANPDSMAMALDNFSRLATSGNKYVILGDMLELGEDAPKKHKELGEKLAQSGVEGIWVYGQYAPQVKAGLEWGGFKKSIIISDIYEEKLARSFGSMLTTKDIVLIKGSRGMKMERVLEVWNAQSANS